MITSVTSRIGGSLPVRTKTIIAAAILYAARDRGRGGTPDEHQGEALRGDRADDPRAAGDDRGRPARDVGDGRQLRPGGQAAPPTSPVAREFKFAVTDVNGWQTAYGYDNGPLEADLRALGRAACGSDLRDAGPSLDRARRRQTLVRRLEHEFDGFMRLDASPSRPGSRTAGRRSPSGSSSDPRSGASRGWPTTAEQLAALEIDRAAAARRAADDARDTARKRLIAVALGAALVIVLLLVTANDVARLALEGERRGPATTRPRTAASPRDPGRTPDAEPAAQRRARGTLRRQPAAGPGDAGAGRVRRPSRAVGARCDRRAARLDRRPADLHARGLADPLLRRPQPLAEGAAQGLGRARRCWSCPGSCSPRWSPARSPTTPSDWPGPRRC